MTKTATNSLVVLLVLSICSAAIAQRHVPDLLAHNSDDVYWVVHVSNVTKDDKPSVMSRVIARRLSSADGWKELAEIPERVTGLAHLQGDLAMLLSTGDWKLISTGNIRTGQPLPNGWSILRLATAADDTLWALGAPSSPSTSPSTLPTVEAIEAPSFGFFQLERGAWVARGKLELPGRENHTQLTFALNDGRPVVAILRDSMLLEIHELAEDGDWAESSVRLQSPVNQFDIIPMSRDLGLWIAPDTGGGEIRIHERDWSRVVQLNAPADVKPPRAIAFASEVLRLLYLQSHEGTTKLMEQTFDASGNTLGEANELSAPKPYVPGSNRWVTLFLTSALVLVMLSTLRKRRSMEDILRVIERHPLAPHGLRLGAGIVDLAPYLIAMAILVARTANTSAMVDPTREPIFWIGSAVYILHTTLLELMLGRSIGKLLFGLRVVNLEGQRASTASILLRNILRLVDVLIMVPWLFIWISPLRQRIGDIAANTLVIRDKAEDSDQET